MEDEGSRMEDWGWGKAGLRPGGSTSAARTHTNATLKLFQQNCQTNATRGGVLVWKGGDRTTDTKARWLRFNAAKTSKIKPIKSSLSPVGCWRKNPNPVECRRWRHKFKLQ